MAPSTDYIAQDAGYIVLATGKVFSYGVLKFFQAVVVQIGHRENWKRKELVA
jgi:hypothetical protein